MSVAENKKVLEDFFGEFTKGNYAGLGDFFHQDLVWEIPGNPDSLPLFTKFDKATAANVTAGMGEIFPNGIKFTLGKMIGEDDHVACLVESYGETRLGSIYNNRYNFWFTFKDGKIVYAGEYFDTEHCAEIFRPLL